jgi:3-dehydroquinate synthase
MKEILVNIEKNNNNYSILIGKGLKARIGKLIAEYYSGKKIVIITDENVGQLYLSMVLTQLKKQGYQVYNYILPVGEKAKSNKYLKKGYNFLLENEITRDGLIIALGGGVTGDLAGFIAATYMRGIKFIQIPTSLIAQVDSSVGGKTAINHGFGKNLIGAFYHPQLVIIDHQFLQTLPSRHFRNGMAEVIKYALINDKDFFNYLRENSYQIFNLNSEELGYIINKSCQLKVDIVSKDEKDRGKRRHLNFGHTIGHALESIYSDTSDYLHGEAVSLGIYFSSLISRNRGYLSDSKLKEIELILQRYKLPIEPINRLKIEEVWNKIKYDKKRGSRGLSWVLLNDIGESFISEDVHISDLKKLEDLF